MKQFANRPREQTMRALVAVHFGDEVKEW